MASLCLLLCLHKVNSFSKKNKKSADFFQNRPITQNKTTYFTCIVLFNLALSSFLGIVISKIPSL